MRKQTLITGGIIAVIIIVLGLSVLSQLRNPPPPPQKTRLPHNPDLDNAAALLEASQPEEVLALVQNYMEEIETLSPQGIKWLSFFVEATTQLKDRAQLVLLFEYYPDIFKNHESGALLVADTYLSKQEPGEYEKVRRLWLGREMQPHAWLVLDADKLLQKGRRNEAIALLKSRTFVGEKDLKRLLRLGLLHQEEDPKTAWNYLLAAYKIAPDNPDIHFYRAQLLESVGKNQLASREFYAAAKLAPADLYLQEELADFYLRKKQYPKAGEIWKEQLSASSPERIWVKSLFWSKVAAPLPLETTKIPTTGGKLNPFIHYLMELKPGEFWDEKKIHQIATTDYVLQTQQATFWLRLLEALKSGNETKAANFLKHDPFATNSWKFELKRALQQVLAYRASGAFPTVTTIAQAQHPSLPPLFRQLSELSAPPPPELKKLLLSKEAFSALLIAAEWYEAGLQLHNLAVYPEEFPPWAAYNYTQTLRWSRSDNEALEFALQQPPSLQLALVIGELLTAKGETDMALEKLVPWAQDDSELGVRAAWLSSLLYIKKEEYGLAEEMVTSQPRLAKSTLGKELLARLAHLEGDPALATEIYEEIEKDSPEARTYLANKAFAEKDWGRARKLTEQLIRDYPDNPIFKENLSKIVEAQRRQKSGASTTR